MVKQPTCSRPSTSTGVVVEARDLSVYDTVRLLNRAETVTPKALT
jgi:hypothetical protein